MTFWLIALAVIVTNSFVLGLTVGLLVMLAPTVEWKVRVAVFLVAGPYEDKESDAARCLDSR